MEIDIKPITKDNYTRHYKAMEKEATARRWNGLEDHTPAIQEEDLIQDLLENPKGHKFSTLNSRRNALIYTYKRNGRIDMLQKLYEPDFMEKLRQAGGMGNVNSRPSGRMIPEKDYWKLHYRLGTMKEWGIRAQHLMMAGLASGARPIEWVNAKWIDKENGILRLQTAKVKNINAWNNVPPMFFGEIDHEGDILDADLHDMKAKINSLQIPEEQKAELRQKRFLENEILFRDVFIEEEYRSVVTYHLDTVQFFFNTHDQNYTSHDMPNELKAKYFRDVYYNSCRQSIYQACKKLFDDGTCYSPVDTRSTFAANRRAMNGIDSAAIELGNEAGGTRVQRHYARGGKAWAKYLAMREDRQSQKLQSELQTPEIASADSLESAETEIINKPTTFISGVST